MRVYRVAAMLAVMTAAFVLPGASPATAAAGECVFGTSAPDPLPPNCSVTGTAIELTGADSTVDGGAAVPPAGQSVHVDVMTVSGPGLDLTLSTASDGTVEATGSDATANTATTGGPDKCSDDAYNFEHTQGGQQVKWYSGYQWYLRTDQTPSYLNNSDVEQALHDGGHNILDEQNSCNMSGSTGLTQSYQGSTTAAPNIDATTNNCLSPDGVSVTSFGNVAGSNTLAATCWWATAHSGAYSITESDARFDKFNHTFYIPGVTTCNGDYSLEATATHERGHTFGLDHVSESLHGYLTMSPDINGTCENTESSLGRGDVDGLKSLY